MCLENTHSYRCPSLKEDEKPKTGYKVFKRKGKGFCGPVYKKLFQRGKWYIDKQKSTYGSYCGTVLYDGGGFHIFLTLEGARRYRANWSHEQRPICQVEYSHVTVRGTQIGKRAVRAMRMKIIKMVK